MGAKFRIATTIMIIAITSLHLWSLIRFPPPFTDEAWTASRAWAFAQTGKPFGPLDAGVFDRFETYWIFFPWLPTAIQSITLRWFPVPNLFGIRLTSLIVGLVLLFLVYSIGNRFGGKKLGLLSVVFTALSWPFFYSAHLGRTDIIAATFGFAAIAIYLNNPSANFWKAGMAGLLAGLGLEVHPHSAIILVAILGLYFLEDKWRFILLPSFWSFVAGVLAGFACYLIIHVLPNPQTFRELNLLAYSASHVPPILTMNFSVIRFAFSEAARIIFGIYLPLVPILLVSIYFHLKRNSQNDKILLSLCALLFLGFILLIRNKFLYYLILFTPALDILVASYVLDFLQRPWRPHPIKIVQTGLVWGLCLGSFIAYINVQRTNYSESYLDIQQHINQSIRPGDVIMANQLYWFGLYDHLYYSWEEIVYFRRYIPGSEVADALMEFKPDIFIIDNQVNQFIADDPESSLLYSQELQIPKKEMDSFLSANASLVAQFDGGYYGQIRIYRINWDKAKSELRETYKPAKGRLRSTNVTWYHLMFSNDLF